MTEQLDLTTPIPAKPGRNSYTVDELHLQIGGKRIDIWLKADNGERLQHVYRGEEAVSILASLNKMASPSLLQRVMQRLIDDQVLDGTLSGAPE